MLIRAESLVNKEASARRKTLVVRAINAAILNLAHRLTNLAKETLSSNRSGEVADLNQRRRDPSMADCAQLTPNRADSDTGGDDNEDTIMVQAPTLLSDAESTQWSLADQDMFSYLSTAVPDIWTVHDVSAFDPSMLDIPVSILPDDAASDLVLTPADTGQSPALRIGDAAGKGSQTSVITQHDAIESRSRRYVLDVPPELVVFPSIV